MASGDWSANCKLRPQSYSFVFDDKTPPDIISISVQYAIELPSGVVLNYQYIWTPAAPIPIGQGLQAIQSATQAVLIYEGLQLG